MFSKALSTRRTRHRRDYEQLRDHEATATASDPKLSRNVSSPAAKILGYLKKMVNNAAAAAAVTSSKITPSEKEVIKKMSRVFPLFSVLHTKSKKKATANPIFSRYMNYVKEGGGTDFGI
ncbi:hypothetical protein OROGR_018950 [Orobanche gracilis]